MALVASAPGVMFWEELVVAHPPEAAVAPMHFPTLMRECEPPDDIAALTAALIARKAVTHELGAEPLPAGLGAFIDGEFERARQVFEARPLVVSKEARQAAEQFFREVTLRLNP